MTSATVTKRAQLLDTDWKYDYWWEGVMQPVWGKEGVVYLNKSRPFNEKLSQVPKRKCR